MRPSLCRLLAFYRARSADAHRYCFEPDAQRELWTLLVMGTMLKRDAEWIDNYWLGGK